MSDEKAYTTFEAAKICHVTHHSIKNWIKQGLIRASRTPGGHYRILASDLDVFLKEYDMLPKRADSAKKRVMVIDDEQDTLDMITRMLESENYEMITVSNATEAGLKAAQLAPDVILLDFLMPELNGYDVTRALRNNSQTKGIPIMAVTCLTKQEEVDKITSCGVDDYLAKPFKSEDLLAKVKVLLGENVETSG